MRRFSRPDRVARANRAIPQARAWLGFSFSLWGAGMLDSEILPELDHEAALIQKSFRGYAWRLTSLGRAIMQRRRA